MPVGFSCRVTHDTFIFFYPRPVLAFGYCHCLRLCVCVCVCVSVHVCVCVNPEFLRAPFNLASPEMQNTVVKIPLVLGACWPLLSRLNWTWKWKLIPFWVWCHESPRIEVRISKFGPKMHVRSVNTPLNFGINWLFIWSSFSFSILTPFFYQIDLRCFCKYSYMYINIHIRIRLYIYIYIVRPSLATDGTHFRFWLKISFVVNHRWTFRHDAHARYGTLSNTISGNRKSANL